MKKFLKILLTLLIGVILFVGYSCWCTESTIQNFRKEIILLGQSKTALNPNIRTTL
jgi:hypothetical protein